MNKRSTSRDKAHQTLSKLMRESVLSNHAECCFGAFSSQNQLDLSVFSHLSIYLYVLFSCFIKVTVKHNPCIKKTSQ